MWAFTTKGSLGTFREDGSNSVKLWSSQERVCKKESSVLITQQGAKEYLSPFFFFFFFTSIYFLLDSSGCFPVLISSFPLSSFFSPPMLPFFSPSSPLLLTWGSHTPCPFDEPFLATPLLIHQEGSEGSGSIRVSMGFGMCMPAVTIMQPWTKGSFMEKQESWGHQHPLAFECAKDVQMCSSSGAYTF